MLNFKGMSTKEKVLFSLNPTAYLIGKGSVKAVEKVQDLTNSNATVQELRNEAVPRNPFANGRITGKSCTRTSHSTKD